MMQKFSYTECVNSVKNNDKEAFALLYSHSYGVLKKEALKYMGNDFDADDILQNTYLSIYRNIGSLTNPEGFIPWSVTICRNYCINECNRKNRAAQRTESRPEVSEDETFGMDIIPASQYDINVNPEASIEASETKRLMDNILDSLPKMQRTCILLWQEDYSIKEISSMADIPMGTVSSNIHYAKKKIKESVLQLEKQGTKLYGLSPVAFFIWIMRQFSQNYVPAQIAAGAPGSLASVIASAHTGSVIASASTAKTLGSALVKSTAAGAVKAGAGATAAKVGAGITAKVAAIIIAGAVGFGGIVGVSAYTIRNRSLSTNNTVAEATVETSGIRTSYKEVEERAVEEPDIEAEGSVAPKSGAAVDIEPEELAETMSDKTEDTELETTAVVSAPDETAELYKTDYYTFDMPEEWKGLIDVKYDIPSYWKEYPNTNLEEENILTFEYKGFTVGYIRVLDQDSGEFTSNGDIASDRRFIIGDTYDGKRVALWIEHFPYSIPAEEHDYVAYGYLFVGGGWTLLSEEDKEMLTRLVAGDSVSLAEYREMYARSQEGEIVDLEGELRDFINENIIEHIIINPEKLADESQTESAETPARAEESDTSSDTASAQSQVAAYPSTEEEALEAYAGVFSLYCEAYQAGLKGDYKSVDISNLYDSSAAEAFSDDFYIFYGLEGFNTPHWPEYSLVDLNGDGSLELYTEYQLFVYVNGTFREVATESSLGGTHPVLFTPYTGGLVEEWTRIDIRHNYFYYLIDFRNGETYQVGDVLNVPADDTFYDAGLKGMYPELDVDYIESGELFDPLFNVGATYGHIVSTGDLVLTEEELDAYLEMSGYSRIEKDSLEWKPIPEV